MSKLDLKAIRERIDTYARTLSETANNPQDKNAEVDFYRASTWVNINAASDIRALVDAIDRVQALVYKPLNAAEGGYDMYRREGYNYALDVVRDTLRIKNA